MSTPNLKEYLQDWKKRIYFKVKNNPEAVRDMIDKVFIKEINLAIPPGEAYKETSIKKMQEFLEEKAQSGPYPAEHFATWVFAAIPFDGTADNWTTTIK